MKKTKMPFRAQIFNLAAIVFFTLAIPNFMGCCHAPTSDGMDGVRKIDGVIILDDLCQGSTDWFVAKAKELNINVNDGALPVNDTRPVEVFRSLLAAREAALLTNIECLIESVSMAEEGVIAHRTVTLEEDDVGYLIVITREEWDIDHSAGEFLQKDLLNEFQKLRDTRNVRFLIDAHLVWRGNGVRVQLNDVMRDSEMTGFKTLDLTIQSGLDNLTNQD